MQSTDVKRTENVDFQRHQTKSRMGRPLKDVVIVPGVIISKGVLRTPTSAYMNTYLIMGIPKPVYMLVTTRARSLNMVLDETVKVRCDGGYAWFEVTMRKNDNTPSGDDASVFYLCTIAVRLTVTRFRGFAQCWTTLGHH